MSRRVQQLLREYIHESLYARSGYFSSRDIIAPTPNFDFCAMVGRAEYTSAVRAHYASSPQGWLTPAELFAPHYSAAVARYILAAHAAERARAPLRVIEIGGGSGAHARAFCDAVRMFSPSTYATLDYEIVEISPALAARQSRALASSGHGRVARVTVADATRGVPTPSSEPVFVVALEVLDNLVHDKVVSLHGVLHETWVDVEEAGVESMGLTEGGSPLTMPPRVIRSEVYRPLADPLVRRAWSVAARGDAARAEIARGAPLVVRAFEALGSRVASSVARALPELPRALRPPLPPRPAGFEWALHVPSGAVALLDALSRTVPAARLFFADFNALPAPRVSAATVAADACVEVYAPADAPAGCGGPPPDSRGLAGRFGRVRGAGYAGVLVASKDTVRRETVDHATPLSPVDRGSADVFFPTDFQALASAAGIAMQCGYAPRAAALADVRKGVKVVPQTEFLKQWADLAATQTRTGFNPLVEDYMNMAVLVT